jgi:uncharacterized protein
VRILTPRRADFRSVLRPTLAELRRAGYRCQPKMRPAALLFATALSVVACGRSEEPAGARPARAATVTVPAGETRASEPPARAAPAAPSRPRCAFPTPDAPPPKASPASRCPSDPDGNFELARGHMTFVDAPGNPRVEVELARSDREKERGLMYRTGMPEDAGMLFSWSENAPRTFWMRNTCIPLDMLFIDKDGFVVGVLEQVPTLNDEPRAVPCPAAHVLELNAGWARAHGIRSSQRVRIED